MTLSAIAAAALHGLQTLCALGTAAVWFCLTRRLQQALREHVAAMGGFELRLGKGFNLLCGAVAVSLASFAVLVRLTLSSKVRGRGTGLEGNGIGAGSFVSSGLS